MRIRPDALVPLAVFALFWLGGAMRLRADEKWPDDAALKAIGPLSSRDEAFDVRVDLLSIEKGNAAAYAFVEKEFRRDPRPHVKARLAEYLMGGKSFGGPDGEGQRGLALAREALAAGSLYALKIIGWQLVVGLQLERDPERGVAFMRRCAESGNANGMLLLGRMYQMGWGVPVDSAVAERWFYRAAVFGKPDSLFELGAVYENAAQSDVRKACELYYEAATRGSKGARKRLFELAKKGDAFGVRADHLVFLWFAARGADVSTTLVRAAVKKLEADYPEDPVVLVTLGRINQVPKNGYFDYKKAWELFSKAAKLGSADGRAEAAMLMAEGYGTEKNARRAVEEWRALESEGNARALGCLGYFHYWGSLKDSGLEKDPQKAFEYVKRAADLGDATGLLNAAKCYESGVGVAVNYGLAAKYYRGAAWRGVRWADEQMRKCVTFALK